MRPGRRTIAAGAMGVTAAAVLAAPSVVKEFVHPRDEAALLTYVTEYVGDDATSTNPYGSARDRARLKDHPAAVLAEGQRACDWLAAQPDAPAVDPSGRSDSDRMAFRYMRDVPSAEELPLARRNRFTVVAGAWSYLCWWDERVKTAPRSLNDD